MNTWKACKSLTRSGAPVPCDAGKKPFHVCQFSGLNIIINGKSSNQVVCWETVDTLTYSG